MSFSAGHVVQMRSGGPLMTIVSVDGENIVCSWMERSGSQRSPKYSKKESKFTAVQVVKLDRHAMGVTFGS